MCLYFSVNDGRCIVTMDLSDMNSDTTSKKEPTDPSELAPPDEGQEANGQTHEKEMARSRGEIVDMIGGSDPDKITRDILFSNGYYVVQYLDMTDPEPEMGLNVDEMSLDESICKHLRDKGIRRFYKFQEDAIRGILSGNSIVIESPTASGKTEAFMIPVIQKIKKNSGVFAVFVYPTKALSRDQLPRIQEFAQGMGMEAGIFDGDTGSAGNARITINPPEIIVTNFDMLHHQMCKQTMFAGLLASVEILVVDEVHMYSGIFGSNVHHIIKRLRRICKKRLQVVAASATIQNPRDFCQQLFNEEMRVIRGAGRRGKMDFVMLFPPSGEQRSLMVDIAGKMAGRNHKTMVFSNSHRNAELVAIQAGRQNIDIMVHRGGLSVEHRKKAEERFKDDSLQVISCTPTLELGMDIGRVDCVISETIPVNRLVQRIGRSARRGQTGYAFLILGNDSISQYYQNHPDDYHTDTEGIYLDPDNPHVKKFHVLAMACDRYISRDEQKEYKDEIRAHIKDGALKDDRYGIVPVRDRIKEQLRKYNIRGIGEPVRIRLDGRTVGERQLPIAMTELHRDAIYMLAGTRYQVDWFDIARGLAQLKRIPRDYPYYTRAITSEHPTIRDIVDRRTAYGIDIALCRLHIQKTVSGYVNMKLGNVAAPVNSVWFNAPYKYDFDTMGVVFYAPMPLRTVEVSEGVAAGGYHAAEHVLIEGSNMITGGVSGDLGGISMTDSGQIFIYDGAIDGSGASMALYDRFEKAVTRGLSIVRGCPCTEESGCPRCTFSYRCGSNNEPMHKHASLEIFERIIRGEKTKPVAPADLYLPPV